MHEIQNNYLFDDRCVDGKHNTRSWCPILRVYYGLYPSYRFEFTFLNQCTQTPLLMSEFPRLVNYVHRLCGNVVGFFEQASSSDVIIEFSLGLGLSCACSSCFFSFSSLFGLTKNIIETNSSFVKLSKTWPIGCR